MRTATRIANPGDEEYAEHLVKHGLRVPIAAKLAQVSKSVAAAYYRRHHGRASPSGQLPTNMLWHADGYRAATHSALVVLTYLNIVEEVKALFPEAKRDWITARAYGRTLAFYNTSVCNGDPLISPERMWMLTQHFSDRAALGGKGASQVKLSRCACCGTPMLVRSIFREFTCEVCKPERAPKH
jgi:Flagellar transcriptional activator (FlhC)